MPVQPASYATNSREHTSKGLLSLLIAVLLGTTVQCCQHEGRTYRNGQIWQSKNFLMKCTTEANGAWKVDIVACILDDGSRLELNDRKPVGDDEFSCILAPDGTVSLQQMLNVNAGCGTHPIGDIWKEGNFEYECHRGGKQILRACITDCNLRINAGQQISAGGQEIKCEQLPDGTVWMHGIMKKRVPVQLSCLDHLGNKQPVGSQWRENTYFEVKCSAEGKLEVMHCVAKDGTIVPLNQSVRKNGFLYRCQQITSRDYQFTYESENSCCS